MPDAKKLTVHMAFDNRICCFTNPRKQHGWEGSQDSSSTSETCVYLMARTIKEGAFLRPRVFWRRFVELEVAKANSHQAVELLRFHRDAFA